MSWFRLYSELVHDPKVQRLSAEDFKSWINLLCCAKEADKGGQLPSIEALAYSLRKRSDHVAAVLRRLSEALLLDTTLDEEGVKYWIHGWSKRQFVSDLSTKRVQKHRSRNVSETPRARTEYRVQSTEYRDRDIITPSSPPLQGDSGGGGILYTDEPVRYSRL